MGKISKALVNAASVVIYGSLAAMVGKVAWDYCGVDAAVKRARKRRAQKYAEVRPEEGDDED